SSVRERGAEGVLRVILIGLTDEDPYEAERRLAQEVQKLKEGSPGLLFVDLVNRIEDVRQPVSMPAFGGGVEFAAKILEPFGRLAPEATKIVEETG
ncbi:MAG: hypothetical protein JTT11_06150, partial [Candidatus Brockarchaeota archaeon]|nr:hypothetical protein [Candidatus Brockarchaeota archaeon]